MSPKASSYISNDSAQLRVRGRPIVRVLLQAQALSFKLLTYMPYLNLKLDTISVSRGGNLQGDALDTTSMSSKPLLVKLPSGTLTNHNIRKKRSRDGRVYFSYVSLRHGSNFSRVLVFYTLQVHVATLTVTQQQWNSQAESRKPQLQL